MKPETTNNQPKRATLYTGLVVEYAEVRRDGHPYLQITDPESGAQVSTPNTSDLFALRDILQRVAPRSWQFRLWLWRKLTFRELRARRRLGRYVKAANVICDAVRDSASREEGR